jgi:hypothetical protein
VLQYKHLVFIVIGRRDCSVTFDEDPVVHLIHYRSKRRTSCVYEREIEYSYNTEMSSEPGWLNQYSASLRAGRSGDRIPVGARFSGPVQTGSGAHPASYTMGTGSFPGVKWPGRGVDHPPHLAPKLMKEYRYNSTPPLGLRGLFYGELCLYIYTFYLFIFL